MAHINSDRLLSDLRELASIGPFETGVDRVALSAADIAARRWLVAKLQAAGLDAAMDRVGNVLGRYPDVATAVLIGSHTDTVPKGGWLDGALGVIYGLEIARSAIEAGERLTTGIDVVSFEDEEGTFLPFLGSRSFCNDVTATEIEQCRSRAGGAAAGGAPIRRAGRAAAAPRSCASALLSRSPYRARPASRSDGPAHRGRDCHRRHPPFPYPRPRARRPCRHDADGRAKRCRR